MRIEKSIFKYIEHELYNYENTKKELESYKDQILEATSKPETAVQSGLSDTTANKAIKLSSSAYVLNCERILNAIDSSIKMLRETHKELFELKYIKGLSDIREISLKLNISESSYFRIRRELVHTVGMQLGLIREK